MNPSEGVARGGRQRSGRSLMLFLAAMVVLAASGSTSWINGCSFQPAAVGTVGTATCLGCHDGRSGSDMRHFRDSIHAGISCETCHGPGYTHVRNGGRGGLFIQNPGRLPFNQSSNACTQCHADVVASHANTLHATTRSASCHDCHDVHRAGGLRVPLDGSAHSDVMAMAQLCGQCHSEQTHQFLTSSHAQLSVATCVSCHDMHSLQRADMFTADPIDNSLCLQCHGSSFLGFNTPERIDLHTGDFHPVDPAGSGASRCISCHMPPVRQQGQPFVPHDHSMMTIPPELTNEWADAGILPVPPNSCAGVMGCHDANVPGSGMPFDVNNPDDNRTLQNFYELIGQRP